MSTKFVPLTILALFASLPMQAQPMGFNMRFGQFWGTFVWRTAPTATMTLPPTLVTYHADGTITGSDGIMFGGLNPAIRVSPFHGTWVRTGLRSLGGTSIYFVFNATTGAVTAIGRSRATLEFEPEFDSFTGKMVLDTLPCPSGVCPDPTDPAATWVPSPLMPPAGFFAVTGKRLERVALPASVR